MKNLTLAISVTTLLLAGQSAMAGSQDEVTIPEASNSIVQSNDNVVFLRTALWSNTLESNNATKNPLSLEYSSDK